MADQAFRVRVRAAGREDLAALERAAHEADRRGLPRWWLTCRSSPSPAPRRRRRKASLTRHLVRSHADRWYLLHAWQGGRREPAYLLGPRDRRTETVCGLRGEGEQWRPQGDLVAGRERFYKRCQRADQALRADSEAAWRQAWAWQVAWSQASAWGAAYPAPDDPRVTWALAYVEDQLGTDPGYTPERREELNRQYQRLVAGEIQTGLRAPPASQAEVAYGVDADGSHAPIVG